MTAFISGEIWGNGAGAAKALTVGYVASTSAPLIISGPVDLFCKATIGTTAADSVEIRLDWNFPNAADYLPIPYVKDEIETVEFGDRIYKVDGTLGDHSIILHIPRDFQVRVMAKRTGGGAGTTMLLTGFARSAENGSILSALGSSATASEALNMQLPDSSVTNIVLVANAAGNVNGTILPFGPGVEALVWGDVDFEIIECGAAGAIANTGVQIPAHYCMTLPVNTGYFAARRLTGSATDGHVYISVTKQ